MKGDNFILKQRIKITTDDNHPPQKFINIKLFIERVEVEHKGQNQKSNNLQGKDK